jgi:hypothetical protein
MKEAWIVAFQFVGEDICKGLNLFVVLDAINAIMRASYNILDEFVEFNKDIAKFLEKDLHEKLERSIAIHLL